VTNNFLPAIQELPRRRRARSDEVFRSLDVGNDLLSVAQTQPASPGARPSADRRTTHPASLIEQIKSLEKTVEDQRHELFERCAQVADLVCTQQQQTDALLSACDAIKGLERSLASIEETAASRESEIAAAKQQALQSLGESNALRDELARAKDYCASLVQKGVELSEALNARDEALAKARSEIAALETALAAKADENAKLTTALRQIMSQRQDAAFKQSAELERQNAELRQMLSQRDRHVEKTEALLMRMAAQYKELLHKHESAEAAYKQSEERLKTQADMIVFLETVLRVRNETAG
jgi:chromosome segregation ATPase